MKGADSKGYILYAEDDIDDQVMLADIMLAIDPQFPVVSVENGFKAMEYLTTLGDEKELPCCIILDLNMPVWDGLKTLKILKEAERFSHIPVCMFSSSPNPRDATKSTQLGAEAFYVKPFKREDLLVIGKKFNIFCSSADKAD